MTVHNPIDEQTRQVIDATWHNATRRTAEAVARPKAPFAWEPPRMTASEVRRAAELQEKTLHTRFINLDFQPPTEQFVLASFKVTPPKGESLEEAANHVTLESSTGTWTDVQTETSYTLALAGTVYHCEPGIEGHAGHVKVAYPLALFEPGSAAQLLSCIGGNILAMRAVERIKLMDFQLPPALLATFPGPRHGIPGLREITGVTGHTLVGAIVKPKTGLFPDEYAQVMEHVFEYGCVVKDDENLTDQPFCPFDLRAYLCYQRIAALEARLRGRGIDERKLYLPNVTTRDAVESLRRAYFVSELGARGAMIDIVTAGFSTVQMLRNHGPPLAWHGHRAMHAGFARIPDHGIDMMAIAKLSRLAGIDELHIGTVVGKMEGEAPEVLNYAAAITADNYAPLEFDGHYDWYLPQPWHGMRPTMPVNSGGLYPKHLLRLSELFGTDTITTMGGGIHGYGTLDGAWGARLGAEAAAHGYSLAQVRERYDEITAEIGFAYAKPAAEALPLLDRLIAGQDWQALAFSKP